MITPADFAAAIEAMAETAAADIAWAEACTGPASAEQFARETIFVICNSGMHHKVARQIFGRVMDCLENRQAVATAFRHEGKAAAIESIWRQREVHLAGYLAAVDKVAFCETLPWIGGITKYHLAKNFGADVAKPDVHLQRLADMEGCTPQQLCERLSAASGLRVATVDTVLWRACATGVIDSSTGQLRLGNLGLV